MKNKLKLIFDQVSTVTFFVTLYMGIEATIYHFAGEELSFNWYTPFAVILLSVACCVISMVLLLQPDAPARSFRLRVIAHFVLMAGVVLGAASLFRWYTNLREFCFVACGFVMVYVLAWVVTLMRFKYEEVQISRALEQIRDEE